MIQNAVLHAVHPFSSFLSGLHTTAVPISADPVDPQTVQQLPWDTAHAAPTAGCLNLILPPLATLIAHQLCAMAGRELLLPFDDVYWGLATRPASFAGALPSKEPSVLENLRSLGALRNAVSKASLPSTSTGDRVAR